MKKSQKISVTLTVLIISILALLFLNRREGVKYDKEYKEIILEDSIHERNFTSEIPKKIIDLQYSSISSLKWVDSDKSFELTKNNDYWLVNGLTYNRIDKIKIDLIIRMFLNLIPSQIVSSSTENLEQWGFVDDKYFEIRDSEAVAKLKIGSMNPTKTGYYVLLEGSNDVCLISDRSNFYPDINLDDIRDRALPKLNTQKLYSISINYESSFTITPYIKGDDFEANVFSYMLTNSFKENVPVSSSKLLSVLESLKEPITIADLIDSGTKKDYEITGDRFFQFNDFEGKEFKLLLGMDYDRNKIYASLEGDEQIFTVKKSDLSILYVKPFDLMDKFAKLISLDVIDLIKIKTDNREIEARVVKTLDDTTYLVDGITMEEKKFKKFYETVVYLLLEGVCDKSIKIGSLALSIDFRLYGSDDTLYNLSFYNYDDDFYALSRNGSLPEFVVGKYQVEEMISKVLKTVNEMKN